jgi:hypothetical protein
LQARTQRIDALADFIHAPLADLARNERCRRLESLAPARLDRLTQELHLLARKRR